MDAKTRASAGVIDYDDAMDMRHPRRRDARPAIGLPDTPVEWRDRVILARAKAAARTHEDGLIDEAAGDFFPRRVEDSVSLLRPLAPGTRRTMRGLRRAAMLRSTPGQERGCSAPDRERGCMVTVEGGEPRPSRSRWLSIAAADLLCGIGLAQGVASAVGLIWRVAG